MPPGYAAVDPSETTTVQAECVFEQAGPAAVEVIVRFLQVQRRTATGVAQEPGVPSAWDEAVEHEVPVLVDSGRLLNGGFVSQFQVPGGEEYAEHAGTQVMRRREQLTGTVSVHATALPGPWQAARLTVRVENTSPAKPAGPAEPTEPREPASARRDEALPTALVAAHMIITVFGGRFVSMTDPPEWAAADVSACENIGCWPVLADPDGGHQAMLASPIILPDHPELASESPGELYDGTEIDEILSLRTLALSDEEKRQARATDPRAAALIDRVEALDGPAFDRMHGTIRHPRDPRDQRGMHAQQEPDAAVPWWNPEADASVSPGTDAVTVDGQQIARGSRVTLRPGVRRADAQDMFLAGRPAVVEAVLYDVDDQPYLAVTLADEPDPELRSAHGRFLYFAPDEVQP